MNGAVRARLSEERWHFQCGPIDLVIGANGDAVAVAQAHQEAWQRFSTLLPDLVAELAQLKQAIRHDACSDECALHGSVARRMWLACHPHRARFITPMAAVAGSVADELIAYYRRPSIRRAYINNGGDIALHLTDRSQFSVGLFSDLSRIEFATSAAPALDGRFTVPAAWPVRGIATSGWRGRSCSLGIADSVTVLAATAAQADAAATMVANAVDLDDAGIVRMPAHEVKDDSDLGDRLVTVGVPILAPSQIERALDAGMAYARHLQAEGHVFAAALCLQGQMRLVLPAEHAIAAECLVV